MEETPPDVPQGEGLTLAFLPLEVSLENLGDFFSRVAESWALKDGR